MLSSVSLVFTGLVYSQRDIGSGMDLLGENYTFNNETFSESNTTLLPDSDSTDDMDFSLPMGIGASLGIIGLIITLLGLKENKKKNELDTIESNQETFTKENHIVNIDEDYETIQNTLYELED
jgi:hypothetical protein